MTRNRSPWLWATSALLRCVSAAATGSKLEADELDVAEVTSVVDQNSFQLYDGVFER